LETSKRRSRFGIAKLASRLSKLSVAGHPSDGEKTKISEFALEGYVSVFLTGNLPRGATEVDECGLTEIGNSKEETRGTQFRQVGPRGV
jgi:hypothetical protein